MIQDNTTKATNTIAQLKEIYLTNRPSFDFYVSQYVSGDSNKELRREIIRQMTGEEKPLTKCGMYAVSDILQTSFSQYQLF